MSSEAYKPHHQRATTLPDAGTFKEVAEPYPRRPATIENASRDDCTLEVSDRNQELFSDRQCNLELVQYADSHVDKETEAAVGNNANESKWLSTADVKDDPEAESTRGTTKRRIFDLRNWRLWLIIGAILAVLIVIIVPVAVIETRKAKAQSQLRESLAFL